MTSIWSSLAVTLAVQILAALVLYVPPVLAPAAQAEIGVRSSSVGIVTALIFAAATFAALRSGPAIARRGALRMSQLSLLLAAAGLAVMTTANAALIALGALIVGLGYGVVTPSSSSILADRAPQRLRAFIFSLKQTGVPVGGALAGAVLPALVALCGAFCERCMRPSRRGARAAAAGTRKRAYDHADAQRVDARFAAHAVKSPASV